MYYVKILIESFDQLHQQEENRINKYITCTTLSLQHIRERERFDQIKNILQRNMWMQFNV